MSDYEIIEVHEQVSGGKRGEDLSNAIAVGKCERSEPAGRTYEHMRISGHATTSGAKWLEIWGYPFYRYCAYFNKVRQTVI